MPVAVEPGNAVAAGEEHYDTGVTPTHKEHVDTGVILTQEEAELLTGQSIHPDIFDIIPTGNLIFVVTEELPEKYGDIIIPKNVHKPPAGVGYIIAAGPYAGHESYARASGVASIGIIANTPHALLGLHILFGAHTGTPIHLTMLEKRFSGQVLMMVARDAQAIDGNSKSLVERAQDKIVGDSAALIVSA